MAKKLITDEEMEELTAKGCIGLCPMCGMPVYRDKEHEESETTYAIGKRGTGYSLVRQALPADY